MNKTKATPKTLLDMQGSIKTDKKIKDWDEVRKKAWDYATERVVGNKRGKKLDKQD